MNQDLVAAYDYDLPDACIAQYPAPERDRSRLLFMPAGGGLSHHVFSELPRLLRRGDLLVRNDTRVIPARLRGRRSGGGKAELLLVHRLRDRPAEAWQCLARPAGHLKPGRVVVFGDGELSAVVRERLGQGRVVVEFEFDDNVRFMALLQRHGQTPLPPYIQRPGTGPGPIDAERYQTVYAASAGAVAAPTAGLHFTPDLDRELERAGVNITYLTLHVGPGTFRPVKAEYASEHVMDEEFYQVTPEAATAINDARETGGRIIAVGTTSTRVLESVADDTGRVGSGQGWTGIFIRPGYRFRVIDALITNFHLPRSTLLMLVAALAGRERVLDAYREAIAHGYRFYSYGDAMLVERGE